MSGTRLDPLKYSADRKIENIFIFQQNIDRGHIGTLSLMQSVPLTVPRLFGGHSCSLEQRHYRQFGLVL